MNPIHQDVPPTNIGAPERAEDFPSVPRTGNFDRNLLIGFLVGGGCKLRWNADNWEIFAMIKKLCARVRDAESPQAQVALPNTTTPMNPIDYSHLSPADASTLFQSKVDLIQRQQGCDLMTAWKRAELEFPELYKRVEAGTGKAGITAAQALANEKALNAVPVAGPQLKTLLGLPADADDEEVKAAWRANKGQSVERDSKAILAAMRAVWSGRLYADPEKRNASYFSTLVGNKLRERFPILWQAAG